jgi:hypothetical protein
VLRPAPRMISAFSCSKPAKSCSRKTFDSEIISGSQLSEELAAEVQSAGDSNEPSTDARSETKNHFGKQIPPFGVVSAAFEDFLTRLACSIKDGSYLCEFLWLRMMKR